MEAVLFVTLVVGFLLVLITGCVLTALGLPGNWLMVIAGTVAQLLAPDHSRLQLGWAVVGAGFALALFGEGIEFLAGALGVAKKGGSRRSALLAMGGSVAGAVVGGIVGVPIPFIGPVIGIVLFSGIGAFAGALWGEYMWVGRDANASLQIGVAAFWGRLFGTLAKSMMSVCILALFVAAMIW